MTSSKQLPTRHDLEMVAGNPFTLSVTTSGATITSPVVTIKNGSKTTVTADPSIPTVSQASTVTTVAFVAADTSALGASSKKTYTYSLQALVNGAGPYELVAGVLTVSPVGTAGTSSTSTAALTVTVGAAALALTVDVGSRAASDITVTDTAGNYVATNVETVLAELPAKFAPTISQLWRRSVGAPAVMATPPTVTFSASGASTGIAGSANYPFAPAGVLVPWVRLLGSGTPTLYTQSGFDNCLGASLWYTDGTIPSGPATQFSFDFMTDSDDFELVSAVVTSNQHSARVWVDGEPAAASMPSGGGSGNSWRRLRITFATKAARHIRIESVGAVYQGIEVLATARFWAAGQNPGPRVVAVGDSFTEGTGVFRPDGWVGAMAARLGWSDVYASGLGGTGYLSTNGARGTFRSRAATDIIAHAPDIVIIAGGYNDTASSAAAVEAEAALLFAQIKAGLPNCELIVLSPWSSNNTLTSLQATRDAIFAAADGVADLTIDAITTGQAWIFGTGKTTSTTGDGNADFYIASDGIHPSAAGYTYLGARVANAIADAYGVE